MYCFGRSPLLAILLTVVGAAMALEASTIENTAGFGGPDQKSGNTLLRHAHTDRETPTDQQRHRRDFTKGAYAGDSNSNLGATTPTRAPTMMPSMMPTMAPTPGCQCTYQQATSYYMGALQCSGDNGNACSDCIDSSVSEEGYCDALHAGDACQYAEACVDVCGSDCIQIWTSYFECVVISMWQCVAHHLCEVCSSG